jgi:hypothetical protein
LGAKGGHGNDDPSSLIFTVKFISRGLEKWHHNIHILANNISIQIQFGNAVFQKSGTDCENLRGRKLIQ